MINHIQILNIADHLKIQKYALNKQRAETIIEYVKENQVKEIQLKKDFDNLYQELNNKYIKLSNEYEKLKRDVQRYF